MEKLVAKTDRRIQRTRQSLIDALIAVALENGYDAVTIKEITRHANVSYSTFFRHFKSKDDLTTYVFRTALQNILSLFEDQMGPKEEALIAYQHMSRNPGLYQLCASFPRDHPAAVELRSEFAKGIREFFVARKESVVPIDALADHFSAAMLELTRWWLESDLKYSPEQMAAIHYELINMAIQPLAQYVGSGADDKSAGV